jgi:hypothetical protein
MKEATIILAAALFLAVAVGGWIGYRATSRPQCTAFAGPNPYVICFDHRKARMYLAELAK